MACVNPMLFYPTKDGRYKFAGYRYLKPLKWDRAKGDGDELAGSVDIETGEFMDCVTVPCRQCIGCRIEYSKQWMERACLEAELYPKDECWFLTLTYDDDHLPSDGMISKKELQNFIKRLRRYSNQTGIRYLACGEYGEQFGRPHYHLCVFGLRLVDAQMIIGKNGRPLTNELGDFYYQSDLINSCWSYGFVVVGKFTSKTAGYTARYVLKKQFGNKSDNSFVQPFLLSSRRPGLGLPWLERYGFPSDYRVQLDGASHTMSQPRYFDYRLKQENPEAYELLKKKRMKLHDEFVRNSDYSEAEYLTVSENNLTSRLKKLFRNFDKST